MRIPSLLGLLILPSAILVAKPGASDASAFKFGEVMYFHRWAEQDQHEYTPEGQDDLERWSDMMTVNLHRTAKDGDALANVANAVLENYKRARGIVVRTDSKPRAENEPAEHLVVVILPEPTMIEVAFARFKLVDGMGCVMVYSHREYGEKIGDQVSAWLRANGPGIEKTLMAWDDFPRPQQVIALANKPVKPQLSPDG
jgi:hypothetical protein